jgi:hypothetical protein
MADTVKYEKLLSQYMSRANTWSGFLLLATEVPCIRSQVVAVYKKSKTSRLGELNDAAKRVAFVHFNPIIDENIYDAANYIWTHNLYQSIIINCAASNATINSMSTAPNVNDTDQSEAVTEINMGKRPFDRRLDRLEKQMVNGEIYADLYTPFDPDYSEITTSGYLIGKTTIEETARTDKKDNLLKIRDDEYKQMQNDEFYVGVPALQNTYALIKLYGSKGGKLLVNQKNQRRWYEVDGNNTDQPYNFASVPTTTTLIDWGNGDPFGRTPYHFTDFVFSKYWNKIANNRLITLRRYAAPILDNLNFPGMSGMIKVVNESGEGSEDLGSVKGEDIPFPPMASAITYFGGETGNSLNNILKFTTGVLWDDAQAAVWEVNSETVPDNTSGPAGLYGGIAKFAELLNVAGGNFNPEFIMNQGQLPPDPYNEGPYENRIMGPINRIDSVKKRKPGMAFSWDGLNIVFEYVARPIGGINPKAALLDILSNFLVIGSASAVFFGGAHRFMSNPAKYPFPGGSAGIEAWYTGHPVKWALTAINQFSGTGKGSTTEATSGIIGNLKSVIDQILSGEVGAAFGSAMSLFSGGVGNIVKNAMAKKSAGAVPYLRGLKAILTGEPVGEWHLTVGNPLNPIALIGNLICEGIDVEFNEELGPDDFPTEMKITVKLKHAMARDRDAIESVFNRGMGRIYELPDNYLGTADYQTQVDKATGGPLTQTGYAPNRRYNVKYHEGMDSGYIPKGQAAGSKLSMGGDISVWNRNSFSLGATEKSNLIFSNNEIFKSSYRAANWIAQKALK